MMASFRAQLPDSIEHVEPDDRQVMVVNERPAVGMVGVGDEELEHRFEPANFWDIQEAFGHPEIGNFWDIQETFGHPEIGVPGRP